jgi:site-specific recombinase XerD
MRVEKIEVGGEYRIKVELPYNQETALLLKQIPDTKWNQKIKAWHIPYRKDAFSMLKSIFPDLDYPGKSDGSKVQSEQVLLREENKLKVNNDVCIQVFGRSILIKVPKNQLDIHFIRSLKYSRWDKQAFQWVVPNYPGNLDLIKDFFKGRIREMIIHDELQIKSGKEVLRTIKTNQLLMIRTDKGRIKLIFGFNRKLTDAIKKTPFYKWDVHNKWWSIPSSEKFFEEVKSIAVTEGMEIIIEDEHVNKDDKAKKISRYDLVNYRSCPEAYILKLKELRYSEKTIKTYVSMFEEFINYYPTFEINRIDEKMIIGFLQYLVINRKVSESYQNQSINAIKFYYERVLGGQRKIYMVERPRKERKLPVVLSESEVAKAIGTIKNIKHKAIMMVTYSGGLRISETINLKIKDIDTKRMQIFVRNAKGGKDRYTLLSKKVVPVLQEYYRQYRPKEWLFEGAKGQQYSESSIAAVVKTAFMDAGIKKKASTHTLRHCFATHLLENGTDIRYIQSLLGHESSKTTEIYTHVTNKGFDQIINPLDKLDI